MKQQRLNLAVAIVIIALFQTQMPMPTDPSGQMTAQQLIQQHGDARPHTGLIADPSGVAVIHALKQKP